MSDEIRDVRMLPRIIIDVSQEVLDEVTIKKGNKTHREVYLDSLGINFENRHLGRPKNLDDLFLNFDKTKKFDVRDKNQDQKPTITKDSEEKYIGGNVVSHSSTPERE